MVSVLIYVVSLLGVVLSLTVAHKWQMLIVCHNGLINIDIKLGSKVMKTKLAVTWNEECVTLAGLQSGLCRARPGGSMM